MNEIKQFLFDCGGVFVDNQFHQLLEHLCGDPQKADLYYDRIFYPNSPWSRYDLGLLDDEGLYREMQLDQPDIDPSFLKRFIEIWTDWLIPYPQMTTIVDELHAKGYPCYLLSNFSHRFATFSKTVHPLQVLDGKVISYQVHMAKPNSDIYEYTAEKFGINPQETLFVDDYLPNIEGARKVGYQAYLFTTPDAFRQYLKEQGIL